MPFTIRFRLISALFLALIFSPFLAAMPAAAAPRQAGPTPTPAPCVPVLGQHDVPATSFESSCLDEPGQIRPVDFAIAAVFKTSGKASVKFRSIAPLTIKSDPKQNAGVAIDANTWSPELPWEAKSSGKAIRIIPQGPVEVSITSSVNPFTIKAVPAVDAPTPQPTAAAAPAPNSLTNGANVYQAVVDGPKAIDVLDGKKPLQINDGDSFELALVGATKPVSVTITSSAPRYTFSLTSTAGLTQAQVYSGTKDYVVRVMLSSPVKFVANSGAANLRISAMAAAGVSDVLQVTVTRKAPANPAPANAGAPTTAAGSGLPRTGPADEVGLAQPNLAPATQADDGSSNTRWAIGLLALLAIGVALARILRRRG